MFVLKNVAQVSKQIDAWEQLIYQITRETAIGYSVRAFKLVLTKSAQYSGDFAANWKYSVGSVDTSFQAGVMGTKFGGKPGVRASQMGNPKAITYAINANKGRTSAFALGDEIFISNSAEHTEPYAWKIENKQIRFRPGNKGAPMARTLAEMRSLYQKITPAQASRLRKARL